MTKIIPRNTTIPTKKSEVFSTAVDSQSNVEIHVLQGEREMAKDNKDLGLFRLDGIPPAPRGVPQIEVTFDIDANGILNVTAKDKGTGKEQSISITGASTLPDKEVDRMVKEAEENANEDKERREKIDRKNQADSLVYQADKQLKELEDKVSTDDKSKAEDLIKQLKEAIAEDNDDNIKSLTEELQQLLYSIGTSVYQQSESNTDTPDSDDASNPSSEDDASGTNDDVIDAEFSESK